MKILIRQKGRNWQTGTRVQYPHEEDLQSMLHESPNLIPVRGGEESPAVFIREAGLPGSGSTDLLGVDVDGNIYIVECKLASNSEIRRKVIGQVLEYAAFLWEMSYDDLDQLFIRKEGKRLAELLSAKSGRPLSLENFRAQVSANLGAGKFDLMIAVDAINHELERIIQYLAACGSGIRLEAIEMSLFRCDETEILVPEIHGREIQEVSRPGRLQTIDQVLESCPDETCRSRLSLLVNEWQKIGNSVVAGTRGLSFRATLGNAVRPVFWALGPEFVCVNFRFLQQEGFSETTIDEFKKKIAAIRGFNPDSVANQKEPRAYFRDLDDQGAMDLILAASDIVEKWRKSHL